ncbi:hypothetical protein U1872_06370 [Sphingomonas sp. RB3P16]|uniref:hypothetical protein n=1 Tax=Parasphingomonas frigoris TaxID=3096163 RepID=UPI002FC673DE
MAAPTTTNLGLSLDTTGDFLFKRAYVAALKLLDAAIGKLLFGSATYDAPSLVDGAGVSTTVAVPGAALGDFVTAVSLAVDLQGIMIAGYVSAANTVTVRLQNESGATVDLASTMLRVIVRKA